MMLNAADVFLTGVLSAGREASVENVRSRALQSLQDREAFGRRLEMLIKIAERQHSGFAVLLLELGGAECSERDLNAVAAALRTTVRLTDTVAWLEANRFAILLSVPNAEGALRVGGKILDALSGVLGIEAGHSISVGMALHPTHGKSGDLLLRAAEGALFQSCRGRHGIVMAVAAESPREELLASLGQRIGVAMEQDEFELRFQPVVNLLSGLPVGAEALVRWRHPELGLLPPAEFLHLAEYEALLEGLSLRLVERALGQIRTWRERGLVLNLSLNLASALLATEGLDHKILSRMHAAGLPPESLTLELRDEGLASLPASALRSLFGLASAGVCLSIDDFGRGTGSLMALRDLPVQEFKIDASFIRKICSSEADAAIVASLISLGRRLGKTVIAKGIETEEERQKLRSLGGEYAQGFYFSQALPARELEAWRDFRLAEEGVRQTQL